MFLSLAVISTGGIIFLIGRHFPQVANVDTDNLPVEREARKKRDLIRQRVTAQSAEWQKRLVARLGPFKKIWGRMQLKFRIYVGKVEKLWQHEQMLQRKSRPATATSLSLFAQEIDHYIEEGETFRRDGRLEQAEKSYIEAIKRQPRAVLAYRGLAETYRDKGSLTEAFETYQFLFQLEPNNDTVAAELGALAESQGKIEDAIQYYQQAVLINDSLAPRFYHLAELFLKINQPAAAREAVLSAVELEPKNPRYLDLAIETAILCHDQRLAKECYQELRSVNPDNQKLAIWKERIGAIS